MIRFVKVKYADYRYPQKYDNDMWLNLDNIVAFDEHAKFVYTTGGNIFSISDDSATKLIEALKGGAE